MLVTAYVIILVVLEILSALLGGSYLDNLAVFVGYSVVVLVLCAYKKMDIRVLRYAYFLFSALLLSHFLSFLVNSKNIFWFSTLYELGTLFVPMLLLPLLALPRNNLDNFYFRYLWVMFFFCWINIFGLILQYLFGADVLPLSGKVEVQFSRNRPTGFFPDANTLADFFVMVMLSVFILKRYEIKRFDLICRYLLGSCFVLVVLSSSKHAILCVLFYMLFSKPIQFSRLFLSVSIVGVVLALMYFYDIYDLQKKLNMYAYALSNLSSIDTSLIENRVKYALDGLKLLEHSFPFGYGLGTWGDASSLYNIYMQRGVYHNHMSDSFITHIFVEQGMMSFLYLAVLFYPFFRAGLGILIPVSSFVVFLFTVGLNSDFWPVIYSLVTMLAFDFYRRQKFPGLTIEDSAEGNRTVSAT